MLDWILRRIPRWLVWKIAQRYIAGTSLEGAVAVVRRMNDEGFVVALSYLGEHSTRAEQCDQALTQYLEILETIHRLKLRAQLSVKPSQLGLPLDFGTFLQRTVALLTRASALGIFVRLDMEDSKHTQSTLLAYRILRRRFPNIGTALQATLHRSKTDAASLLDGETNLRVCKGIYPEPRSIAWQRPPEIWRHYLQIVLLLMRRRAFVALATHNERMLRRLEKLVAQVGLPPERYIFEMLLGVRFTRARQLLAAGHPVLLYVGFGAEWYEFALRRMHESPQLIWLGIRGLFSRT
ncbi:MAG: proline dehydrogenase family protein [Candidatus Kerfeldbacteria bacterium]|nr:proline dehydrogenase family protein [Candidatus Kerfeldbacteria bacterium]